MGPSQAFYDPFENSQFAVDSQSGLIVDSQLSIASGLTAPPLCSAHSTLLTIQIDLEAVRQRVLELREVVNLSKAETEHSPIPQNRWGPSHDAFRVYNAFCRRDCHH